MGSVSKLEPSVVGSRIEVARKRKGLSQAKLAEMVGVTRGSISIYETGTGSPSYKVLLRLSVALDIDISDLTGLSQENHIRFSESVYDFSYINGWRSGLVEKHLNRIEKYRDVYLYGEPHYLAYLGIRLPTEDLPVERNEPIEWPSVSVLMLPGVDYSLACVGVLEDNSMRPRYPEGSRHVLHPIQDRHKWPYLTGLYGFSVTGADLIIRRIIANKAASLTLVDADDNELTVSARHILMIWRIGQTVHMPPES